MRNPDDDASSGHSERTAGLKVMPSIAFALDADGVFIASEGEGLTILGLRPGEVVGRSAFEVYRDEPNVNENLERALLGESFTSVVNVLGIAFRCRYDPLRNREGKLIGTMGLAEETNALQSVAQKSRLMERAMAASSDGIIVTDPNHPGDPIVYVNPAFEEMTGYPIKDALGRNCRFLQGEDRDQPQLDVLRRSLREERECRVVLRNYRKDGIAFWNELSVSPVYNEAGHLTNFVGVQKDVTERVRREEELRESEERFRATFEAAGVGMAHVAPDGRWLRINSKLSEIVGYPNEELLSLTFQEITHPDDLEKDLEHVRRMQFGEIESYSIEKRYVRRDGRRVWAKLAVSALRAASGSISCFVSVVEDVTERKIKELASRPLTVRETEVLELVVRRRTNEEIAHALNYSEGMIRHHVGEILKKLRVRNRVRAAEWAVENGLITPPR